MRLRILGLAAAALMCLPASASAYFLHVVTPGETLTSVAAIDGLSVAQLAAANGISTTTQLIAGSTLTIPPQSASSTAAPVAQSTTEQTATPSGGNGYIVQPGDTLSGIAARAGTTVVRLASLNGLDPNGILYAGASVTIPAGGTAVSAATQPVGQAGIGSGGPPYPTHEYVSSSQIASVAAANGVPSSLAEAVGWQESGFNNGLVSSTGAVGVMQIEPGTWDWINRTLTAGTPLEPASATDNVRGGVLLLRALLNSTGGNAGEAAAGYFQGLSSVQQNGLLPSTQQYVNDVLALQQRFGGG